VPQFKNTHGLMVATDSESTQLQDDNFWHGADRKDEWSQAIPKVWRDRSAVRGDRDTAHASKTKIANASKDKNGIAAISLALTIPPIKLPHSVNA